MDFICKPLLRGCAQLLALMNIQSALSGGVHVWWLCGFLFSLVIEQSNLGSKSSE